MFFDEAFENLDEEGVYSMFELLREKAKTNAVYMITHNKYSDIYGLNQILVTKENNNSIYEKTY
jgi:ABC-type multidrug transport system ATPase subunit